MLWLLAIVPLGVAATLSIAGQRDRLTLAFAAASALAVTLLLATLAAVGGWEASLAWGPALWLQAAMVPLSAAVAIAVPAVALPIALYAAVHEQRSGLTRLVALLLAFVGAMELLVIAADLLTLLIAWELVGACSWALIGHHWRDPGGPAAGRYAFITTRLGDLGLFIAAMAAFAGAGSFAYADLPDLEGPMRGLFVAGVLVSAAAKSGQVPFAPWLFRAMAGPTSASALLHAAAMVAAGAFLLARLQPALAEATWFAPAAITIGLVTALAGGIVAALQADAKKLLAASTSAHFGLMFVAVGAGYPAVAVLHLIAHAAFKALLFLTAGIAGEHRGTFALAGRPLGRAWPWIAAANAVGALALAGVPPLGGAWTKDAVTAAAGHAAPALAVAVMFVGGLSALYAGRLHWMAWRLGGASSGGSETPALHRIEHLAVGLLAAASLLLSLLWLPGVRHTVAAWLGAEFPHATGPELALSLLLVALGAYAGWVAARQFPELGTAGAPAMASDWLGLPRAIDALAVRPTIALAHGAAVLDDRAVDALPRGTARLGRKMAEIGSRVGEALVDGLPQGLSRIVSMGGIDARRAQTGMSQHYYAVVAAGVAVLTIILLLGGLA